MLWLHACATTSLAIACKKVAQVVLGHLVVFVSTVASLGIGWLMRAIISRLVIFLMILSMLLLLALAIYRLLLLLVASTGQWLVVLGEDLLDSFACFTMAIILTPVEGAEEHRIQLLRLCLPILRLHHLESIWASTLRKHAASCWPSCQLLLAYLSFILIKITLAIASAVVHRGFTWQLWLLRYIISAVTRAGIGCRWSR